MNETPVSVVVGSKNPVKINAVKAALKILFPDKSIDCQGVHAPSNVAEQPMSEAETRVGALNRVQYCQKNYPADFYAAIEGGVENFQDGPATFAYVVIAQKQTQSVGRSANLPLPAVIYQALVNGEELGHVMDRFFNTENIKQKGGAMALLTHDNVTREGVYTLALQLALAPFLNETLFNQ